MPELCRYRGRHGLLRVVSSGILGLGFGLRAPDLVRMSSTDLVNAGSPPRQRGGGLRYSTAWTKKSGDRSNEQGRGGAYSPPRPQASAASRRLLKDSRFPPARTSRSKHECEIQGVRRVMSYYPASYWIILGSYFVVAAVAIYFFARRRDCFSCTILAAIRRSILFAIVVTPSVIPS